MIRSCVIIGLVFILGYIHNRSNRMKHLKSIDEFKQVNEQLFGHITRELTKTILKNDDSKSKDDSGGAGGGTGVSSRTLPLDSGLALCTETGSGTGVSCASFRTPLLERRPGCLGSGTGVSSRTPLLNRGCCPINGDRFGDGCLRFIILRSASLSRTRTYSCMPPVADNFKCRSRVSWYEFSKVSPRVYLL